MKEVTLNRLRLGKQFVGYRFEITEGSKRVAAFDVPDDKVKAFFKMFLSNDIKKGVVIDGNLVGNTFVTSDEENVFEVTSRATAEALLGKYYFGEPDDLEDIINITETAEEISIRMKQERKRCLNTIITGKRPNLSSLEYGNEKEVKKIYGYLKKSATGVECDILYRSPTSSDADSVLFDCHFVDFREMLKFVHNILGSLGRKNWSVVELNVDKSNGVNESSISLKKARIPRAEDQSQFVSTVLTKLQLDGSSAISVKDITVNGQDTGGNFFTDSDTFVLEYYCEVQGHEGKSTGSLKVNKFFTTTGKRK